MKRILVPRSSKGIRPPNFITLLGSGFTLVEMLIVIAIIGILASLLMPALSRAQATAKQIDCASQLRQIGIAQHSYAGEYQGSFALGWVSTDPKNWQDRIGAFLGISSYRAGLLQCPAVDRNLINTALGNWKRTYGSNTFMENGKWKYKRIRVPAPSRTILSVDIGPSGQEYAITSDLYYVWGDASSASWSDLARPQTRHIEGANVLFCDSHVQRMISPELTLAAGYWKWW